MITQGNMELMLLATIESIDIANNEHNLTEKDSERLAYLRSIDAGSKIYVNGKNVESYKKAIEIELSKFK